MSPELINAIKERIQNGHGKESIKNEVLAMGHTQALFEAAYVLAEHDINEAGTSQVAAAKAPLTLTSVHTLVKDAFSFVCDRWGMVVLLGVPLIITALLAELQLRYPDDVLVVSVLSGISLAVMVFYFVNILTVLYLVSQGSELEKRTYFEAFQWTKKNILATFFVYFLTILAVLGGFMLFIVPGFVVLITLYFSQYIFVVEGKHGMAALVRSRELVKGHWFKVLKKVIGIALYFLIPVFIVSFIIGLVGAFYSLERFALIGEIALEIAAAFFTVMSMHVMFRIYRELAAFTPDEPSKKGVRVTYWILAGIGLAAIPAILIMMFVFNGMSELRETVVEPVENNQVLLKMSRLDIVADEYLTNQGTFEGVCEELTKNVDTDSTVVCNDVSDSWAVSATEGEDLWCIDSKQAAPKRIQAEIGEQTACIVVE